MNNNFAKIEEIILEHDDVQAYGADVFKKSGEHRLLVAILERAILDLVNKDCRLSMEAEEWFKDPYLDYPNKMEINSFQYICAALDLNYFDLKDKILMYKISTEENDRINV